MSPAGRLLARLAADDVALSASEDGTRLRYDGPGHVVTPALLDELAAHKPELLAVLAQPSLGAELRRGPASQQQLRMLGSLFRAPRPEAFTVPTRLVLTGELDVAALRSALRAVIDRHDALRSRIVVRGHGEHGPVAADQIVHALDVLPLPVLDLSALPQVERAAQLAAVTAEAVNTPIDPTEATLPRLRLVRTEPRRWVLLLLLNHIAIDGWSLRQLITELGELYTAARDGRPSTLAAPGAQAIDYARWQAAEFDTDETARRMRWWRSTLDGARFDLDVTPRRPRPARRSGAGAMAVAVVPAATVDALTATARRLGATPFAVTTAAMALLLAARAGRRDVVIATGYLNRPRRDQETMVALTTMVIALRIGLVGASTFADLVARAVAAGHGGFDHILPMGPILDALRADGVPDVPPAMPVAFDFHSHHVLDVDMAGLDVEVDDVAAPVARNELSFGLYPGEDGAWRVLCEYATDLYPQPVVDELLARYAALLAELAEDPQRPVGALLRVLAPAPPWPATTGRTPLSRQLTSAVEVLARQLDPAIGNLSTALDLVGDLDVAALTGACQDLIDRHESLRSRVVGSVQEFCPPPRVVLPVHDLRDLPEPERDRRLAVAGEDAAATPVDLFRSTVPLLWLLRVDDRRWRLLIVLSHTAIDGWSHGLLLRELGRRYTARLGGATPDPEPPALGVGEYVRRQRERLDEAELDARAHRRAADLAGARFALDLPTDRPRPERLSGRGDTLRRVVPEATCRAVEQAARLARTTPFAVALAAMAILLGGRSGADDVVISMPWVNRERRDEEELIGSVTVAAIVRVHLAGAGTAGEIITRAGAAARTACADAVPMARIAAVLHGPGEHPPLRSSVQFAFTADRVYRLDLPGLDVDVIDLAPPLARNEMAIGLSTSRTAADWTVYTEYSTDLWDPGSAAQLLAAYAKLLHDVSTDPDRPLPELLAAQAPVPTAPKAP